MKNKQIIQKKINWNDHLLKIKNNKLSQLKIALLSIVVFLLYLHFKDIDNENVELIHKVFDVKSGHNSYIYTVYTENDELKYNEYTNEEMTQRYCVKFESKFLILISSHPMVVRCQFYDGQELDDRITNGVWSYNLESNYMPAGQNNQYLLRSDYSLVDKYTGQVITGPLTKLKLNHRTKELIYASTISKNNRIFNTDNEKKVINEIMSDGTQVKVIDLPWSFFGIVGVGTNIRTMNVSDDGNYLYFISDITVRGFSPDLYFYMVDVKEQSIKYKKKLSNKFGNRFFYINNQADGVVFTFRNSNKKLYTYWLKFNKN
jgi:hypothetical protein